MAQPPYYPSRGSSHEPLCSVHSRPVCPRSHRFPVPARRELASVHVRVCPGSGEITPEVGDCEGAGTVRGASYRCRVTGAADALLMDGESTLCLCDRDGLGAGRFRECPHLENRDMGPPILWRV